MNSTIDYARLRFVGYVCTARFFLNPSFFRRVDRRPTPKIQPTVEQVIRLGHSHKAHYKNSTSSNTVIIKPWIKQEREEKKQKNHTGTFFSSSSLLSSYDIFEDWRRSSKACLLVALLAASFAPP